MGVSQQAGGCKIPCSPLTMCSLFCSQRICSIHGEREKKKTLFASVGMAVLYTGIYSTVPPENSKHLDVLVISTGCKGQISSLAS